MAEEKLRVYQIGLHGIGRYGFERLVELSNHFEGCEVEIAGVYDPDFERLERAKSFAEVNGIEIDVFQEKGEMYRRAEQETGKVMIYDAGTAESSSDNIYRSMENGFFHLAEKPPSMTREQHIQEKKLAEEHEVMWKADFIERENPVVRKAVKLLDGKTVEKIKCFQESSTAIEKVLDPETRVNVKGGDVLDQMINEVYVLDFLGQSENGAKELELENAQTGGFVPAELDSAKLMSVHGSRTSDIEKASTAQTQAKFRSGSTTVELYSSWTGLSEESMIQARDIKEETGHKLYDRDFSELDEKAYVREEARFFVVEGERNLVGDLLHNRLIDMDTDEEIETPTYIHDQLYRVLEKAVKAAADGKKEKFLEEDTDVFMNALFDVRDEVMHGDVFEEASEATKKLKSLVVEDGKLIEPGDKEVMAG